MYTSFIRPFSPFLPPNMTALLSSTTVKVEPAHGGGLSPVVAGQLHIPAVEIEETVFTDSMRIAVEERTGIAVV